MESDELSTCSETTSLVMPNTLAVVDQNTIVSCTVYASAKTKFPSLNLFSLLYTQTQKNKIVVSLKCCLD